MSTRPAPKQSARFSKLRNGYTATLVRKFCDADTLNVGGSVVAVPPKVEDVEQCGFQCVKPQSCITPRPLACSKLFNTDSSTYMAITPTHVDYRGSDLDTRSAADQACEQTAGAGYKVRLAYSISGRFTLLGGNEYWGHNQMQPEKNCWKSN